MENATKTLVSLCILSRLDFCNSLLAGYPQTVIKPLQQVQNSATKLILKSCRAEHAKPLLKQRTDSPQNRESNTKHHVSTIRLSLALPLNTWLTSSKYMFLLGLCALLLMVEPFASLPSKENSMVVMPCFSAVQTWNSLPFDLYLSPSLSAFKTGLKTHLLTQYFYQ